MALQKQGFHLFAILANLQFPISQAVLDIGGGVEISMRPLPTDPTAKRLLIGPVRSIRIVAHTAFLGGIGTLDPFGPHAAFGGSPGDLLRDMGQIGGPQVGVHRSRLVFHCGNRKTFVGDLEAFMLLQAYIHRPIDLLAHVADKALSAPTTG